VLKHTFTFLVHELISTYGVIVGTAAASCETTSVLNVLTSLSRSLRPGWLLTEVPGFPLQMASALLTGFLLRRKRPHQATLWVWAFHDQSCSSRLRSSIPLISDHRLLFRTRLPDCERLFQPSSHDASSTDLESVCCWHNPREIPTPSQQSHRVLNLLPGGTVMASQATVSELRSYDGLIRR
jgi:hypothetical protein